MKSFKDLIKEEVRTVFINEKEFGEIHTLDGQEVTIIIDNNELTERTKYRSKDEYTTGIYADEILFFISQKQMEDKPRIGRIIKLDGKEYIVTNVEDESNMYAITIGVNEH